MIGEKCSDGLYFASNMTSVNRFKKTSLILENFKTILAIFVSGENFEYT